MAPGGFIRPTQHLSEAVRLSSRSAVALASLGRAQAVSGDRTAARQTLEALQLEHADYLPAFELAKLHLALDDRAAALRWLQQAFRERSHSMVFLQVDPHLDALRAEPSFAALAASVDAFAAARARE